MNIFGVYVPEIVMYLYIFIIGMCLGSFFMVVGYRVPKGETLSGRSHCDACHHQLKAWQLIPGISYLLLKGKCHYCSSKIGVFSPVFEVISGVLFVMSAVLLQLTPETIVSFTMMSLLLIITVSDLEYQVIPNKVLLPFFILALVERLLIPQNDYWWYSFAGFLVGFLPLFLLTMVKDQSMGGGDIKLFAVLGIFIGPLQVLFVLFVASLVALIYYIVIFLIKRTSQKQVPFGPFIAIGTIIVYHVSIVDFELLIELFTR
ncbi:prepilin peptidase [Vagococcus sp. BWB3-3]|uniref:Prepilin leader peptidase/N-methyltransferase n=1 Tax=Vagococcus allomyrinae TaxID=2794353 RepID=A0A940PDX5_9ENTE|nr:A24 family peptidase [Vagococcus allomyrinae]MBP1042797.1 prepilin peptidase [Vagococcus allomyrinae]